MDKLNEPMPSWSNTYKPTSTINMITQYKFIPMAEFTVNNYILETTGISPFFANYRLNPRMDIEPHIVVDIAEKHPAYTVTNRLSEIHNHIQSEILFAQD
jgi:hypothetical protein